MVLAAATVKDWPRKGRAVQGRSRNWPAFRAGP